MCNTFKKVIEITKAELSILDQLSVEVYKLAELVGREDNEKVYKVGIEFRNLLTKIHNRVNKG